MLWSNSACSYHPSLEEDFNPTSKPFSAGRPSAVLPDTHTHTHTHTPERADRFAVEPGWLSFSTCNPSRHTHKHNSLQPRLGMWQPYRTDTACLSFFLSFFLRSPPFSLLALSPLFCAIAFLIRSSVWQLRHMEGERKPEAQDSRHLAQSLKESTCSMMALGEIVSNQRLEPKLLNLLVLMNS